MANEYPREVALSIKKAKGKNGYYHQTEYVEAFLYPNETKPMGIFDESFSRFKISINNEQKMWASANIPVRDVPGIAAAYRRAVTSFEVQKALSGPKEQGGASSAYTVQIKSGRLKGQTPAAVYVTQGGPEALKQQWNWLSQNIQKYPANQEQMDAIVDAFNLAKEGRLNAEAAAPVSAPIEIYSRQFKANPHKKRDDGMHPVYDILIVYAGADNYPLTIMINSYWAPIKKREDGTINVMASAKKSEVRNAYKLSAEEWEWQLYAMQRCMNDFAAATAANRFRRAAELEKAAMQRAQ